MTNDENALEDIQSVKTLLEKEKLRADLFQKLNEKLIEHNVEIMKTVSMMNKQLGEIIFKGK